MRALGCVTLVGHLVAACGGGASAGEAHYSGGGGRGVPTSSTGGGATSGTGTGTASPGDTGASGAPGSGGAQAPAGTLTAGTWDDNQNFAFYLSYLERSRRFEMAGAPAIDRADRMVLRVRDAADAPVAGVVVSVLAGDRTVFSAPTGADGTVLFFPAWYGVRRDEALRIAATHGAEPVNAAAGTPLVTLAVTGAAASVRALDVALVIDTTGSMGDEIEYVKAEFDAIAGSVRAQFPGVRQRWALVVYKDEGDSYVTSSVAFTEDLGALRSSLRQQSAGGGGDFPEALDEGLRVATELDWSAGSAARVAFLVADAPHHTERVAQLERALLRARTRGIHVYPVASSGINDMTEHSLRTVAQVTAGRYLFLTDDSGVGGAHQEPTLPCYFVTRLNHAMGRVLRYELTGVREEPAAAEVLRVGGDPRAGRCMLAGGGEALAW